MAQKPKAITKLPFRMGASSQGAVAVGMATVILSYGQSPFFVLAVYVIYEASRVFEKTSMRRVSQRKTETLAKRELVSNPIRKETKR